MRGWHYLTIYKNHTLEPLKELGLNSLKLRNLLHVHSVNYAAKLVHTRRALSSTIINSLQVKCVSHGLSLGWFGLPVIWLCFKRAALCVTCLAAIFVLLFACFKLHASCSVLGATCFALHFPADWSCLCPLFSLLLRCTLFSWCSWFHEALSASHTLTDSFMHTDTHVRQTGLLEHAFFC